MRRHEDWTGDKWRDYLGHKEDFQNFMKKLTEIYEKLNQEGQATSVPSVQYIDLTSASPEYQVSYPLDDDNVNTFLTQNHIQVRVSHL